jgi:hypothetical protein
MQTLTIRFINSKGFVSRLITGSTFSLMDHCEMLSRDGQSWIGAHAWTGIEARPLDWADKDLLWERRYAISMTDEQYGRAQTYIESSIGVKYDYRGILGIVLRRRKLYSTDRKDCSQFGTETLSSGYLNGKLLTAAGLRPLNVLPEYSWMVTPEMLHLSSLFIGRCVYRLG